jgi:SpoIID/LytB domain protein
MMEPEVKVGIVHAQKIRLSLNNTYVAKGEMVEGPQDVEYEDGGILWNGNVYQRLTFKPQTDDASFSLYEVTIGKDFHWERKETQTFRGLLQFIVDEGQLCALNILPVEAYLESVISSEMKATASLEFLKAHAVISRSWLMAQIEKRQKAEQEERDAFFSYRKTDTELVRWYDREDHTLYDVCADDHCQRYQGITKATSEQVKQAVDATRGIVLYYQGQICDARFSKCCGGVSEEFGTCWEDINKPYLKAVRDGVEGAELPDLTNEENARKWIMTMPDAFCNTQNKKILSQILNNYDQETDDFYRWAVQYTTQELSQLVASNLKEDLGEVLDLIPLSRGKSGRIYRLQIVGTKKSYVIGKELEIRRVLSDSHLFSSAFVVDKNYDRFILHGAGWGHGVGLCQIGAAVMGEQGYNYKQILQHYYPGSYLATALMNN